MRAFYSNHLREYKHFTLFWGLTIMKSKHVSTDEQFQLIMECRQSGLSDYQWCKVKGINPSTFYNWINRHRKRGITIPTPSDQVEKISVPIQEVVKVDLLPELVSVNAPMQVERKIGISSDFAAKELPTVEILLGNATIRFFNSTDKSLIKTILECMGGAVLC
jgi:transposase-like protein